MDGQVIAFARRQRLCLISRNLIGALDRDSVSPSAWRRLAMRPRERRDSGQNDLFRARLDQIIDLDHPLAKLRRAIHCGFLQGRFGAVYSDKPTSAAADSAHIFLSILKHSTISPTISLRSLYLEPLLSAFLLYSSSHSPRPLVAHALRQHAIKLSRSSQASQFHSHLSPPSTSPLIIHTTFQPKPLPFLPTLSHHLSL